MKQINEKMVGIPTSFKPLLLSAILLAGKDIEEVTRESVYASAIDQDLTDEHLEKLSSAFAFIKTNRALEDNIKELYELVNEKLYDKIRENKLPDILGWFYAELASSGGDDGKSLGIVLTPQHIQSLMIDLIGLEDGDIIYDCTTGTAGFLVSSILKGKDARYIGCEIEDHMFTIAATNMILRGDGKSNLFIDSCFNVAETVKALKPTCGVLNPPYSMKDKNYSEISFIEHSLSVVQEGGLVAAIVPKSIFLDKNKKARVNLLKDHSLVAVITPPKDLFLEVAGTETAIGVFKAHVPHDKDIKTWLCEFDDGYKMFPKQGRLEVGDFKALSKQLLNRFRNREVVEGYSNLVSIEPEMECLYDCWVSAEKATSKDFKLKLKDFIVSGLDFKLKGVIND